MYVGDGEIFCRTCKAGHVCATPDCEIWLEDTSRSYCANCRADHRELYNIFDD